MYINRLHKNTVKGSYLMSYTTYSGLHKNIVGGL